MPLQKTWRSVAWCEFTRRQSEVLCKLVCNRTKRARDEERSSEYEECTQIKNPDGKAIRFSERRALARRVQHILGDARQVSRAKNKVNIENAGIKI